MQDTLATIILTEVKKMDKKKSFNRGRPQNSMMENYLLVNENGGSGLPGENIMHRYGGSQIGG